MTTLLISQPNGDRHQVPDGHVERPERLVAVEAALAGDPFKSLLRSPAPAGDLALIELVHDEGYLSALQTLRPAQGMVAIDPDTFLSDGSLDAVSNAVGAAMMGLEAVALGRADNVFCAIRPPGHHAERAHPMGFCLVNTIAIAARQAQRLYGAERVAIVDFDVHHGNGTQDIFANDPSVFYASSHESPLYPGTGRASETGVGNIVNAPLPSGSGTQAMRAAYDELILPALLAFRPDFILVSAGFDADRRDPLASLEWGPEDFAWVTARLMDIAGQCCQNRLVSLLEGGYDLAGLGEGVAAHVSTLMSGTVNNRDEA
jgi:acetoin utilization deacetylase AcuC-like enzyme